MDPMDIVGKSKEDASLPKGSVSSPSFDRSLFFFFGQIFLSIDQYLGRFCKPSSIHGFRLLNKSLETALGLWNQ